jgi:hypothetical protein
MKTVIGPDQLCRDAQSLARSPYRAFYDMRDAEFGRHFGNRQVHTFE